MNEPLYRFKLNEETGQIDCLIVDNYETGVWANKQVYWRYRRNGVMYFAYQNNLDKYKSGHVYSFNSDINHARSIIMGDIKLRRAKAHREYERWDSIFQKLKESY